MGNYARQLETTQRLKKRNIDGTMKLSELLAWLDIYIEDLETLDQYKDMAMVDLHSAPDYVVHAYWAKLYKPGEGLAGFHKDIQPAVRKKPWFNLSIKNVDNCGFTRREGQRGTIVDTAWGHYNVVLVLFKTILF